MKKRKKPIVLVTVLVVMLTFAGVMNLISSGLLRPPQNNPGPVGDQAHKTPDKSEVANALSDSTKGAGAPSAEKGDKDPDAAAPMGPRTPAGMPKQIQNKMKLNKVEKPKPNESSIAGQWYTPESGVK